VAGAFSLPPIHTLAPTTALGGEAAPRGWCGAAAGTATSWLYIAYSRPSCHFSFIFSISFLFFFHFLFYFSFFLSYLFILLCFYFLSLLFPFFSF
jgi:hypothetical protein